MRIPNDKPTKVKQESLSGRSRRAENQKDAQDAERLANCRMSIKSRTLKLAVGITGDLGDVQEVCFFKCLRFCTSGGMPEKIKEKINRKS